MHKRLTYNNNYYLDCSYVYMPIATILTMQTTIFLQVYTEILQVSFNNIMSFLKVYGK